MTATRTPRTLFGPILIAVAGLGLLFPLNLQAQKPAEPRKTYTAKDVDQLLEDLSNWGRWGEDDQVGTINLITPEKRRQAAKLVTKGISVSLARNVEKLRAPDNPNPFEHTMLAYGKGSQGQWSMDHFAVTFHGYAHTHMDSLCHIFYRGKMYNGFSRDEVTEQGALKLSIHNIKHGIFTRGILMDIPRLKKVDYLEPATPIYPEDLEAWEAKAGVKVSPGDVVIIRTGRWARRDKFGAWGAETAGAAGLHVSCAEWLANRDIAILGSDAASDVLPSGIPEHTHPVHLIMLHALGVHILDNLDLEGLSQWAEELNQWHFLLTVAPIPVEGGTGSPLNPVATF